MCVCVSVCVCVPVCVCVRSRSHIHREAWNVCGNMNKEIAMQMYVEELLEVILYQHTCPYNSFNPFLYTV